MSGLSARAASASALGLASLLLLTGCATGDYRSSPSAPKPTQTVAPEAPEQDEAPSVEPDTDDADQAAFDVARASAQKWNAAAAPFVADYMDDNVDAKSWLAGTSSQLEDMRQAQEGFMSAAFMMQDQDLSDWMMLVALNYSAKLSAVEALASAVEAGSVEAEYAAQEDLQAAVDVAKSLVYEFPGAVGLSEDEQSEYFQLLGESVISALGE